MCAWLSPHGARTPPTSQRSVSASFTPFTTHHLPDPRAGSTGGQRHVGVRQRTASYRAATLPQAVLHPPASVCVFGYRRSGAQMLQSTAPFQHTRRNAHAHESSFREFGCSARKAEGPPSATRYLAQGNRRETVSYTHLTLPTIYSV